MIQPNQTASFLAAREVCFAYSDRTVLDGVSLSVERGETFGLLGPNGSGKSTLLALFSGLRRPKSGGFLFQGKQQNGPDRLWRSRMGVVFQQASLDFKLSLRENLMLAASLYAVPSGRARAEIEKLLQVVGLAERADEPSSDLSGGMARRGDLIRALIHHPSLLLLDEPTAGLDETGFRDFWRYLKQIQASRQPGDELTIICSTHRPAEADYCDRLAILSAGRVVAIESPTKLKSNVQPDVLVLASADSEQVVERLRAQFEAEVLLSDGLIIMECSEGHRLIPRVVETLQGLELASISLRQPTLADVFLKITGHSLAADDQIFQGGKA